MSFVNMLANNIWTDADIINRTEAMVRAVISEHEELVLNRKVQGAAMGQYTLTAEDQLQIEALANVGHAAHAAGIAARADMALLRQVFAAEAATKRLGQPVIEPVLDEVGSITNQTDIDTDSAERADAQLVVDAASPEVMEWVLVRNPIPEPVPEPPQS